MTAVMSSEASRVGGTDGSLVGSVRQLQRNDQKETGDSCKELSTPF